MSRTNQQRRAAKKRRSPSPTAAGRPQDFAERVTAAFAEAAPPPDARDQARVRAWDLIRAAAGGLGGDPTGRTQDDLLFELATFDHMVPAGLQGVHEELATERLLMALRELYTHGWQPADVVHIVLRRSKSRPAAAFARRVVGHEAVHSDALARAPQEWLAQLPAPERASWRLLGGAPNALDGWAWVASTFAAWSGLAVLEPLLPPPAAWSTRRSTPRTGPTDHDPKMLTRIRALLAKAEATEYAEEAESFTGKAQELMARYAIDEALLADPTERVDVRGRRIHLEDPYAAEKATLLHVCAQAQHCKAILFLQVGMVTIIGPPTELDLTEMLFTSLLVQAVRAMTQTAGRRHDRSPSFRRAFLVAYATGISERLQESNSRVESEIGAELVPVRARTTAAVDEEFERLFPHTVASRSRSYDARGWHAGRAAADDAVFVRGRVTSG